MKWFVGTVLGLIIGLGGYLAWYLGALKPVQITEKNIGPLHLVYTDHVGAYHKIGTVLVRVEEWAKKEGISCRKTFGEYLDDPRIVEEGRLRSKGGCVVEQIPPHLPEDFKSQTLTSRDYVVASFDGSPAVGPLVVYPKVEKYFAKAGKKINGSVIEIYESQANNKIQTTYLFQK